MEWSSKFPKSTLVSALEKGIPLVPLITESSSFCQMIDEGFELSFLNEGGFGEIYGTIFKDIVLKRGKRRLKNVEELECLLPSGNYGCRDENISDASISAALTTLGLDNFAMFHGLFTCDRRIYIAMEKITGMTYTKLEPHLDVETKDSILFQLIYALMMAQDKFQFCHNDLIGSNIILKSVPERTLTYEIDGKSFAVPNHGYCPVIVDFGKSRLTLTGGISIFNANMLKYYPGQKIIPYSGSADICKLLKNPKMIDWNVSKPQSKLFHTSGWEQLTNECRFGGPYFAVIPPFPKYNARDVFATDLFDQYLQ